MFLSSVIARCILYRRLGERRRGEISHGLYCVNSQNRALSLLLPSSPSIQAGLLAKAAWQATQLDCVHIHCCGNGRLGFRPDGGSLWKSPKVTKGLLPHHSAPRLGSVCPNAGLNPWAAATRHPWRGAANPASCRVTHEFKPAFGQRGLTGRLRSRSKADQDQERLASHRGYRLLSQASSSHSLIRLYQ